MVYGLHAKKLLEASKAANRQRQGLAKETNAIKKWRQRTVLLIREVQIKAAGEAPSCVKARVLKTKQTSLATSQEAHWWGGCWVSAWHLFFTFLGFQT